MSETYDAEAEALIELFDVMMPTFEYWEGHEAGEDFLAAVGKWAEAHPDLAARVNHLREAGGGA